MVYPDDGVPAIEAVLVPETLKDALGGVALLAGNPVILFEDVVDDASEELLLSLSKGWASEVESVAGSPAALNKPASCAPCPGAGRTDGRLPECSPPPPSPPGQPADIHPRCTSVAPSIGSATTLMDGGGWSNMQPPLVSNYPPARPTLTPPLTLVGDALGCRILKRSLDTTTHEQPQYHRKNHYCRNQEKAAKAAAYPPAPVAYHVGRLPSPASSGGMAS